MKAIAVTLNVLIGVALLLLLLTMIDKKEYAEVVLEGPVFFGDLLIVAAVSIGPIVITWAILKDLNQGFLPVILIVLGALCCAAAYYTLPSVRQDRLLTSSVEVQQAIDNLEHNQDYYREDPAYYRHLLRELRMFHTMFESQLQFISSAERIQDKRFHRVPMFFGFLAAFLFVNAGFLCVRGGRTR